MRSKPLLPALLLVGAGLSPLAQASSDDSCYPDWSLVGGGVCDTLPFLAPGNDTRANLRLLLADSVEKVALAAASRSDVPAVEVAASHFKLPSGVSLSVLAQV
ncbi:hypothetical protein NLB28_16315 [Pseudomonas aeruginosa]|nr:hypothetical protein [Pseudomonas aeruginosa]MCM8658224.1 hypothetical protein [Pseudomonas aeruginosa]MCM8693565.1 hypothetical protein [Pseudomonas aeruginosa]MCP2648054.1 hypothetical protein [Pseudomonas aeruginosa]